MGPISFSTSALNPNATPFVPRASTLNPNAAPFVPRNAALNPDAAPFTPKVSSINAESPKSNLFSKFKTLLCKVAQAPMALASKIGRALKTTTEHTVTWATFRKVLVRVTCVATIIGISGTVAAMTANPVLGGTVGVLLGAAGQEILNTSVNAFINEGVFA